MQVRGFSIAGHYNYVSLLNHFKHTITFLGLSLSDINLKHLLRISARHNPGNFDYHIHRCKDNKPAPDEQDVTLKTAILTAPQHRLSSAPP